MKTLTLSVLLCGCLGTLPAKSQTAEEESTLAPYVGVRKFNQSESISYYQNLYPLKDPYSKMVDDHGNGYEPLYGVRNFRAVLNGVVYRGGANNEYNKYGKRPNHNPLPNQGLKNLCEEGFGTAIYLYSTNYKTAPPVTKCTNTQKEAQTLNYLQLSPHIHPKDAHQILQIIYNKLTTDTDHTPIYLHCWNGWHASGLISAMALRQFCDYTADQAVNYWNLNTDGNYKGKAHDDFRNKIRAFKPDPTMQISSAVKARVCPNAKFAR